MTTSGERWRILVLFGMLGLVAAGVFARLFWLQVPRSATAAARASALRGEEIELPAPRATFRDRAGRVLAADLPVFEAKAEVWLPAAAEARQRACDDLVAALVRAAERDEDRFAAAVAVRELRRKLENRVALQVRRALRKAARRDDPGDRLRIHLLIDPEVAHPGHVSALRRLDARVSEGAEGWSMWVFLAPTFRRFYRDREINAGIIGTLSDGRGASGLERLAVSAPGSAGVRRWLVDARRRGYWTALRADPDRETGIVLTLDAELQVAASRQLDEAVAGVADAKGGPPDWGALLLIDVPTGGVLAMCGYLRGPDGEHDPFGAFPPTQFVAEPGSVVKPWQIALGVERGVVRWDEVIDCGGRVNQWHGSSGTRTINDSHACGRQTPRGVLVNSSNFGAITLGMRLGTAGLDDYVRLYQFGRETDLPLPGENRAPRRFGRLADLHPREQELYTGPSLCFGYGASMTPVQIARAYLTLLSRRPRELHLISHLVVDGQRRRVPQREPDGPVFLSQGTLDLVTDALIGVAHGEEGSTARSLAAILPDDLPYRLAGKTGTSEYFVVQREGGQRVQRMVRTASFAGWAPARSPRYLALCMLQKTEAVSFYGGRYAAPAAGRLLLEAMARDERAGVASREVRVSSAPRVSVASGPGRGANPSRSRGGHD